MASPFVQLGKKRRNNCEQERLLEAIGAASKALHASQCLETMLDKAERLVPGGVPDAIYKQALTDCNNLEPGVKALIVSAEAYVKATDLIREKLVELGNDGTDR